MPFRGRGATGSGGLIDGPVNNIFGQTSGDIDNASATAAATSKSAAETVRNTYATANASWLAQYDADPDLTAYLYYTDSGERVLEAVGRRGSAWISKRLVRAVKGDPGDVASLAALSTGHIPYKLNDGTLGDSGARVLANGDVFVSGTLGIEGSTLAMADILRLEEANSILQIVNPELPQVAFRLVDFQCEPDEESQRARAFYNQSGEANDVINTGDSNDLTGPTITWAYTSGSMIQVNEIHLKTTASTTVSNVRLKVTYKTSRGTITKYWPSKAAVIDGTGGQDVTSDSNGILTLKLVDLEATPPKNSPLAFFGFSSYDFELSADSVTLKGTTTGTLPWMRFKQQPSEFRDLAWLQDVTALIDDTSIGTDKTRSAENIAQKNSEALKFNARNGQTYAMAAGDIVAAVGGDTWQNGNVEHIELVRDKGAAANFLLPIGVLTRAMNASSNAEQVVLHKGHYTVTIPGQNDLPLDTPIYVSRTGSGNSEQWGFTHDGSGNNTYFVGRIHNDAGTNMYWAWIDFGLVWAHAGLSNGMAVDVSVNGTEALANVSDINFVGDHISADTSGSQVNVNIDPGSMMIQNGTGGTTEIGQGAELGADSSGNEVALDVDGTAFQFPTMWANGEIANGSTGEFIRAGTISGTPRIEESASRRALAPIAAGTALYYRVDGETFSTVVDTRFFVVGNVISSKYRLDQTTHFDNSLNLGSVGISTAAGANAARNATIVLPSGAPNSANFQIPNLNQNQEYTTPFQVGDQIVYVNRQAGKTLNINIQLNGTFQNLSGTSISAYALSGNNSVTIERITGNIWKVVGESKDAVVSDIVVEYDRLNNNHDARQDNRLFTLEGNATNRNGINEQLVVAMASSMTGLDTYATSSSRVVIQSGRCGSEDGSVNMTVASDINLDISSSTIIGGGSETANTWYYIFLFKETSGNGVIGRYSTTTNPTAPSGYTARRLIGAVRNDNSSNFRQFRCQGVGASKYYTYNTEFLTLSNQNVGSRTAVTVTAEVPNLPKTGYPYCQVTFEWGSNGIALVVYHADNTTSFVFLKGNGEVAVLPTVQLNSSGQFHINSNTNSVTGLYMKVIGFNMELHT